MENLETNEQATDMETALFLIKHIEFPCEDLTGHNIRDFYIRQAKEVLPTFTNPDATKLLNGTIEYYENDKPKK